tara:strand:- start:544 stop:2271 length:1728 start_codon:yes stop_codon:yes gene_type:complete
MAHSNTTRHSLLPSNSPTLSSGVDVEVKASFNVDRYLGDALVLPYTFNDIKIKTNELAVSDNINASLYKLHYNFLYINAQTKIASNNFPTDYRGYIASTQASTSAGVGWYPGSNALSATSLAVMSQLNNTNGTVLSGLVDGAFIKELGTSTNYVGFVANSATLMAVQSDRANSTATLRLNTKTVEDATAMSFTNLKSLATDSQQRLFVCDNVNIYKMDVDALLTENPAISAVGRFLIRTIGGKSASIHDKDKFNNPISIRINDDKLYILDKGDTGYKVFDNDLNWVYTASRSTDFAAMSGQVTDIAVDSDNSDIYILSTLGSIYKYDTNHKLTATYTLTDTLESGEQFQRIVFSTSDSNVLYVLSNKNIYKKFKSKIQKSIGVFRLADNNITDERLTFIDVISLSGTAGDEVFVGADQSFATVESDVGKIFKFGEKINYQTVTYDTFKTQTFAMSSINIDSDEYITSWVVNKAIDKLLYNHLLLRDNFHSKFVGTYDSSGREQYAGVNYISDKDTNLFEYVPGLDNYIGLNEPLLAETINRPLNEIYLIQKTLLDMCKEKYTNKYPFATQCVGVI